MRILDNSAVHGPAKLGFSPIDLPRVTDMVARPQGIIWPPAPPAAARPPPCIRCSTIRATPDKNYVTIEDPVEYYLDIIGQVLVREKIGLTFPSVLRALLRQDPDVILVGEIRDFETAEVAFHAALTGHLVYSTLHTNSAVATIARLFDLGLKPYWWPARTGGHHRPAPGAPGVPQPPRSPVVADPARAAWAAAMPRSPRPSAARAAPDRHGTGYRAGWPSTRC